MEEKKRAELVAEDRDKLGHIPVFVFFLLRVSFPKECQGLWVKLQLLF